MSDDEDDYNAKNMARDMREMRKMLTQVINSIREAESEIPEKMRRFVMYFHDIHDMRNMYVEHGLTVPSYLDREIERCDDRYRHLLEDLHVDTGAFERVRQEMTQRPGNRYEHNRLLPKENS